MKSAKSRRWPSRKAGKKSAKAKRKSATAKRKSAKAARRPPRPAAASAARASAAVSSIDDLGLIEFAKSAAQALQNKFPSIVFTSGRRNVQQQANAMAGNVARKRDWIRQTYRATPERDALQQWVDDHPEATSKAAIAAGLKSIMDGWTDDQKAHLSRHFSGQAFDVQPVSTNGAAIKAFIRSLPHLHQFLESEGGLTIWHADFDKA